MTGSILGGAFGLVARRPGAVAIWAVLYLAGIFAIGLLRIAMAPAGAGGLIAAIVTQLLTVALVAILLAAVCRATLHPYKTGWAYLRIGGNELRVFALLLMLGIANVIAILLLGLMGQVLLSGIHAAIGNALGPWPAAILSLAIVGAMILAQVRLSIALPLTYLYERITVDEAWVLSRGHFRALFGAFLGIVLLLLAGWLVVMLAFFWPVVRAVPGLSGPDPLSNLLLLLTARAMALPTLSQLVVIAAALLLTALGFILVAATLASAARELLGLKEGQLPDLSRRG